jgi:2-octaprenyl-6-methoxyphenol hydroxylase
LSVDNASATPRYRIAGSGPVALACALFMVRGGIDPRRVQLQLPQPTSAPPTPADGGAPAAGPRRMLALSEGSRQLLVRIIAMPQGGLIERIEVALSGRSGRTRIEARDFGLAALGHVVPYPDLVTALREAAGRVAFAAAADGGNEADGSRRQPTIIHAGGMPGRQEQQRREFRSRDFRQAALLTEVMAQNAGTTAYECFGRHGPLALLPADPGHSPRYAVVWCDEPGVTAERAAMPPAQLSLALSGAFAAFGGARPGLGALRVCSAVAVAPLARVLRERSAAANEVWIGNAAQSLHPVAGQGLNLGLRDAFELARALADNEYAADPLAPAAALRRFAAQRRLDRRLTTGVTDLLAAGFTWPLMRPLQSALLTAMDLLPPVRRPLANALLFGSR